MGPSLMVEELGRRKVNHGVRKWYTYYQLVNLLLDYQTHFIRLFNDNIFCRQVQQLIS